MPAHIGTIPCPVGGWNTRDSLDRMKPTDAVTMDNFFPSTSNVVLRRGHAEHCDTGEAVPVGSLMEYGAGGGSTLLAACAGKIIDVSTDTPATLATGYASDIWSSTNFSTAGGQFLLAANNSGSDVPWVFDGATVTPVVVTGVTDTDLSQVCVYQQRLFYVQRNSLSIWYTAAGAYQGALTEFDFGGFCTKGGAISGIATWTRDNGFGGVDDLFVIVTTKGELLIYTGPNPNVATTWAMQGRFVLGEPVSGPHCFIRTGPDLLLLCADGFQPLSTYLTTGESRAQSTNLASKIASAASESVKAYGASPYWDAILYPGGDQLIVNVPVATGTAHQYVVNTTTGAWCRYIGMNAYCWSRFAGNPYFGGADGIVYRFDQVADDNGSDVVGEVVTAFSYLGMRGRQKRVTLLRPVVETNGNLSYSVGVNVDFNTSGTLPTLSSNLPLSAVWDTSLWDFSAWGSGQRSILRRWIGASGIGFTFAVHFKVSTQTVFVALDAIDISFEPGGPL